MANRNSPLRQALDRAAASGEPLNAEEIKALPIRRDVPAADVARMRAGLAAISEDMANAKARGANAVARRIAHDTAQRYEHLVDDPPTYRTPDVDHPALLAGYIKGEHSPTIH